MQIFTVAALLVVAGLAIYALQLWRGVWRRNGEQARLKAQARDDQVSSVRLLARSMLDGDLNLSEGAIRLKVMLDHLQPDAGARGYPAIYALHDATAHMPRGAARKQRPRDEIRKLDAQREALEADYREPVLAQARQLLEDYS